MTLRPYIFWPHLVVGVLAGVVIFIMSVTGALLMYEKQMLAWADRDIRVRIPASAERLPIDELLLRVRASHNDVAPAALTMRADRGAPALVTVLQTVWLVDPYSGATLAESAPRLRRFFRSVTEWHRWLAFGGANRQIGRAITGWANLLFLFIACQRAVDAST